MPARLVPLDKPPGAVRGGVKLLVTEAGRSERGLTGVVLAVNGTKRSSDRVIFSDRPDLRRCAEVVSEDMEMPVADVQDALVELHPGVEAALRRAETRARPPTPVPGDAAGAEGEIRGQNFAVVKIVKKLWGKEPSLLLTIRETGADESGEIELSIEEFSSKRRFQVAVLKRLDFGPLLGPEYGGENYLAFVTRVLKAATPRLVPEDATDLGIVRNQLVSILAKNVHPGVPEKAGEYTLGWRDTERGVACVSLTGLLNILAGAYQRRAPDRKDVVWVLESMGAVFDRRPVRLETRGGRKVHPRVVEIPLDRLARLEEEAG
jgi:hypothetical protein